MSLRAGHGSPADLQSRHSCCPPPRSLTSRRQPPSPPARLLPILLSLPAGHCVYQNDDIIGGDVKVGLTALNDTKAPTRKVKVGACAGSVGRCLAQPVAV